MTTAQETATIGSGLTNAVERRMYDAFISYSHAKDKPVAAALQSVIQTLGKPWWKIRMARVFRDDTSLSASPGLWASIETALGASNRLVLLASPEAAASKWVEREVAAWLAAKGPGTILIALTDGDLAWDEAAGDFRWGAATPLPPVLKGAFASEPLWSDLRPFRSQGANRRNQQFMAATAGLAAGVRGMAREDLLSEEVSEQRRNLTWARGAAAGLAVLAGAAVWETAQATRARKLAEEQRDRAQRVLDQVTASANRRVSALSERIRDAKITASEIGRYSQPVESASPVAPPDKAAELNALSKTHLDAEDAAGSLTAAEASLSILAAASAAPGDERWLLAEANARQRLALAHARLGRREKAAVELGRSLELCRRITAAAPGRFDLVLRLAQAHQDLGDLDRHAKQFDTAAGHYRAAIALVEETAAPSNGASDAKRQRAVLAYRTARLLIDQSKFDDALATVEPGVAALEAQAAARPADTGLQRDLSVAYTVSADALKRVGRVDEAQIVLEKDVAIARRLADGDRTNAVYQHDLAVSYARLGQLRDDSKQDQPALEAFDKAITIGEALNARETRRLEWQRDTAAAYQLRGLLLTRLGRLPEAVANFRRSLAIREQVAAASTDPVWQREAEDAYRRTRDLLIKNGRLAEALETAEQQLFATSLALDTEPGKTERVARALGSLSWTALLAGNPARAAWAGQEATAIAPELPFARLNYAHALMYEGRTQEAKQIYLGIANMSGEAQTQWRQMIRKDFAELSARKLGHPLMAEIEREMVR